MSRDFPTTLTTPMLLAALATLAAATGCPAEPPAPSETTQAIPQPTTVSIRPSEPRVGEILFITTETLFSTGVPGEEPSSETTTVTRCRMQVLAADAGSGVYEATVQMLGQTVSERHDDGVKTREIAPGEPVLIKGSREALSLSTMVERVAPGTTGPALGALADLGRRREITVGHEEVLEGPLRINADVQVTVRKTFRVEAIEDQGSQSRILKLRMETTGSTQIGEITYKVTGEGEALVPAEAVDRPYLVEVRYRFEATGGEGPDAVSVIAVKVTTETKG
jgi:hypothetical protein